MKNRKIFSEEGAVSESTTCIFRSRCRHCLSAPIYYCFDGYNYNNIGVDFLRNKRLRSFDLYQSESKEKPLSFSSFSGKQSTSVKAHNTKSNKLEETECLFCKCYSTAWIFKQISDLQKPDIGMRKSHKSIDPTKLKF